MDEELKALRQAVAESKVAVDCRIEQDKENKRLWKLLAVMSVAFAIMACCMVGVVAWTAQNAQKVANEAVMTALENIAEIGVTTETTTTQTVEGDPATINNVEGEQYNDNAQKVVGN